MERILYVTTGDTKGPGYGNTICKITSNIFITYWTQTTHIKLGANIASNNIYLISDMDKDYCRGSSSCLQSQIIGAIIKQPLQQKRRKIISYSVLFNQHGIQSQAKAIRYKLAIYKVSLYNQLVSLYNQVDALGWISPNI